MNELLPCPYCGSAAYVEYVENDDVDGVDFCEGFVGSCEENCKEDSQRFKTVYESEEEAAAAWNAAAKERQAHD